MLLAGMVAISSATAGVEVEDGHGCLDPEGLDLEVREVVGDAAADRVNLLVRLTGEERWLLGIEVRDGERSVWDRTLEVDPADCPFLTQLVARSVERGLSAVPGWQLDDGELLPPAPAEVAFTVHSTLPTAFRVGLGAKVWIDVRGPLKWEFDVEGFGSAIERVGEGGAQVTGLTVGTGPGVEVPIGQDALRFDARLAGGVNAGVGRTFLKNEAGVVPRVSTLFDLGFASRSPARVATRIEVPVTRLLLVDSVTGASRVEPPVRVGLVLGIAGMVRSR